MIHPLIRQRWSPRAFSPRPVEPEKLQTVFEAARWAPSSFNEQPWRFLVATSAEPDWLAELQSYLAPGNRWARGAPVLAASAYRTHFAGTGALNRMALRDLGAAEENMFLQAEALGLALHQMAGFDHERFRRTLLPDGFEPGTMIAMGYPPGGEDRRPEAAGHAPARARLPVPEFVFGRRWGEPAAVLFGVLR
ncbi:MAG TPA: nitroreductase family protein [Gemmatimonadales bacterium]|nr:nitroreductase family protein [Gemmatimonadales bacterium]